MAAGRTARRHIHPYTSAHIINFEWLQHERRGEQDFSRIGGP